MSRDTLRAMDEREHMLRCSTCGKRAQTGFKKHESPVLHWNTVKARDLRIGDVVRPAVGNIAIRLEEVIIEEHDGEEFVAARLSTGLVMVTSADDDVPLMLRERWE